ncbi:MAG: cation-translocating P-type ATPase [Holdemanella sp.]|nr:cation-translocating P-type ATPase [Holdemanella sp.]
MNIKVTKFINRYANTGMWISGIIILLAILLENSLLYLIALPFSGIPIFYRAYQSLRFKTIGIETLVSLAVIGACIIGEYSEAAIVTFLFQFGSYLETKTAKKTRSAIKALCDMAPTTAYRIIEDDIEEIDVDEVEVDDILLVKTGNQIPVDGIVIKNEGYVNEASITGESKLSHKIIGSKVYAGTFLENGAFQMKAEKVGEDTTFAKIIELVEEAQDAKSPVERFIDTFAKYYTPAVVVMALSVYILTRNLDTAITVLVLACPGALVIGAPIANVAGIGRGAKDGILLKGGDSVNTFAKADTFMFDKTGTLTYGRPRVNKVYTYAHKDGLLLAASAEQISSHPISKAILEYIDSESLYDVKSHETLRGYGIKASINNHEVLVGNKRLMDKMNIEFQAEVLNDLQSEQNYGSTIVLVCIDATITNLISISDTIKADAIETITKLKQLGIKNIVMLTGDNKESAECVANQIGISKYYSELLPSDKLDIIKKYQSEGHIVTFVGDGINDSPALTIANTGIAIGSGTDVAIECSDVVLIKSNLTSLVKAFQYARKTIQIMYQNIFIAVGTVLILLIGLLAGYVHMAIGMLIHEASILVVILNAMRLLIIKEE